MINVNKYLANVVCKNKLKDDISHLLDEYKIFLSLFIVINVTFDIQNLFINLHRRFKNAYNDVSKQSQMRQNGHKFTKKNEQLPYKK
jgi:hypothetical protein